MCVCTCISIYAHIHMHVHHVHHVRTNAIAISLCLSTQNIIFNVTYVHTVSVPSCVTFIAGVFDQ